MSDHVARLQEDLLKKLDCLFWMVYEPALHVAEHFVKLRSQVDLDAETLIDQIQSRNRDGKSEDDAGVNKTRMKFIRIFEAFEERLTKLISTAKTDSSSEETYLKLKQRVEQFSDLSSSLDDLEESYVQLALEIIEATDQLESRLFNNQTIFFFPSTSYWEKTIGNVVFLADDHLNQRDIDVIKWKIPGYLDQVHDFMVDYLNSSLLVPVRRPFILTMKHLVIKGICDLKNHFEGLKFFCIGKSEADFSDFQWPEDFVFLSYQSKNAFLFQSDKFDGFDTSSNIFDAYALNNFSLWINHLRLASLDSGLLSSPADRLIELQLINVHLNSFYPASSLAKCVNLKRLVMKVTFSEDVAFDLEFIRPLQRLESLGLTLMDSPHDLSIFENMCCLTYLKLSGLPFFFAKEYPRLTKSDLKRLLSIPSLETLGLNFFAIQAVDVDIFENKKSPTLYLIRNRIGHIGEGVLNRLMISGRVDLYLRHNEIAETKIRSLSSLAIYSCLTLINNSIRILPCEDSTVNPPLLEANVNKTSLRRINLSQNRIVEVESGMFGKLDSLDYLEMSGNPIKTIRANAFVELCSLNFLVLSGCRLKSIDSEMFNGLTNLFQLYLNDNQIESIEVVSEDGRRINVANASLSYEEKELAKRRLFKDLRSLGLLDLSKNKLSKLDLTCFCNMQELASLDLSSNQINELNGQLRNHKMKTLKLNDNQLITMDKDVFPAHTVHLDLSRNKLQRLDDAFFDQFSHLSYLNMAHNELRMTVTEKTFAKCRLLKSIDLSQNESIWILDGAFSLNTRLVELACDLTSSFVGLLDKLHLLALRKSNLSVLQAFFSHRATQDAFRSIRDFSVTDSSIRALTRSPGLQSGTEAIEHFDMRPLSYLERLGKIDFSRNLIETLDDPELLVDLKISTINLSGNHLSRIHRDIFKFQPYISSIDLSGNRLSGVDLGLFRHLKSLRNLDLNSNNISFLNLARLLCICPDLKKLNIGDNQLDESSIEEPIADRSSSKLEELVLAGNRLEKMDLVRDMTNLTHLDLRGNRIDSLISNGENLLGRLKRLTRLDLSRNRIRLMRDEMFAHLRGQLTYIDLSENPVDFKLDSVLCEFI